jgi:hypothetical protein
MRTVLAAGVVAALCCSAAAWGSTAPPALRIAATQPLAVRGLHFAPRERVRVYLLGQQPELRRVRATATGSFRVAFGDVSVDRCSAFALRAVGARGSRAALHVSPLCPPP